MSDLMSAGGAFSTMVLGLALVGLLVAVLLAGAAFMKRRVPLTLLVIFPVATCAVGAIGALMSADQTLATVGSVDANAIVGTAQVGFQDALSSDWFSRWVGAFLFGVGTWAAAVGAFFAGPESRATPFAAGSAAVLTVVAALTVAGYSAYFGLTGGTLMIALFLFAGFGVAFASVKRAMYEHAHRVAGMRFAAAMCMVLAISYGGRALVMGNRITTFGPDGIATQAGTLIEAIGMWTNIAAPVATLGWIAFGFAILIAIAGFYYELGEVVERFTLIDVFLTLVLVSSLGAVRVLAGGSVETLRSISINAPAGDLVEEMGGDLAAAIVQIDGNSVPVRPSNGGFGDVLVYEDEAWTRTQRWNGAGWDDDETPLDSVQQFSAVRPLLVVSGGSEAAMLDELVQRVGGEALLLMRAEEVKANVDVPPELAYLQVTYLPLTLSGERDLAAELWQVAGKREVNWGATTWYGDGMDEEALEYMAAAYEDTQAPGVHAVLSERSRVKGLANVCLVATSSPPEGDAAPALNERFCKMGAGDVEEVRAAAMEVWDKPEPEHFQARYGRASDVAAAGIGRRFIVDRLAHEMGGVDYCLGQAIDEGEELAGEMHLVLNFTRKGSVYPNFHEKSKNVNEAALKCLRDRIKEIDFPVDEERWPPMPDPEEGEEPEVREPQTMDFIMDIRG